MMDEQRMFSMHRGKQQYSWIEERQVKWLDGV